jgi:hypothetical protein
MQTSLIVPSQLTDYSTKEAGPIIVALAFVIALGGCSGSCHYLMWMAWR